MCLISGQGAKIPHTPRHAPKKTTERKVAVTISIDPWEFRGVDFVYMYSLNSFLHSNQDVNISACIRCSDGKESACNAGDLGLIPGSGRSPGEGNAYPPQYSCLENPKESQPWIFTGKTDAETEAPILWSPDAKSQLIGKDPDAEKDWGQKEKAADDAMTGWHHRLNGHEFEQTLGDGGGQVSLACSSLWGCKESDTTELLVLWVRHDWATNPCIMLREED